MIALTSAIAAALGSIVILGVSPSGCARPTLKVQGESSDSRAEGECAAAEGTEERDAANTPGTVDTVDELWEVVRQIPGPRLSDSPSDVELHRYWHAVGAQCVKHFREFMNSDAVSPDEGAREWLLKGIDADGAEGMRWLATVKSTSIFFPRLALPLTPAAGNWYKWQMAGAKAELELLLSDLEARRKLYRVFAWTHYELELTQVSAFSGQIRDEWAEDGKMDWRQARTFVYLAIATGREDLLEEADLDKLRRASEAWVIWMNKNLHRMRASSAGPLWIFDAVTDGEAPDEEQEPSVEDLPQLFVFPEVPFGDWSGPPPVSPPLRHPFTSMRRIGLASRWRQA